MITEAIKNFPSQFSYEPVLENSGSFKKKNKFLVVGMGGSHLAADLLTIGNPNFDLRVHMNYGLPLLPNSFFKDGLVVLSSYSGNTEEVIDAFEEARSSKLSTAAIAVGGKLLDLAKEDQIPYIQLPDTGIQPRMALGFSTKALLKIIGDDKSIHQISGLADSLKSDDFEEWGRDLAEKLNGFVPVIYSSEKNYPIAYNWKIKFNETAKVPAFTNKFPELNHNEMAGFDVAPGTRVLSENFYFLFLRDENDDHRVLRRMDVLESLYKERGFNVEVLGLEARDIFYKIFSSLLLADWTAYYLAEEYGVEPEAVPMVEEFKRLISE